MKLLVVCTLSLLLNITIASSEDDYYSDEEFMYREYHDGIGLVTVKQAKKINKSYPHDQSSIYLPTQYPTNSPSSIPSNLPTSMPTHSPTSTPTKHPTSAPSKPPTRKKSSKHRKRTKKPDIEDFDSILDAYTQMQPQQKAKLDGNNIVKIFYVLTNDESTLQKFESNEIIKKEQFDLALISTKTFDAYSNQKTQSKLRKFRGSIDWVYHTLNYVLDTINSKRMDIDVLNELLYNSVFQLGKYSASIRKKEQSVTQMNPTNIHFEPEDSIFQRIYGQIISRFGFSILTKDSETIKFMHFITTNFFFGKDIGHPVVATWALNADVFELIFCYIEISTEEMVFFQLELLKNIFQSEYGQNNQVLSDLVEKVWRVARIIKQYLPIFIETVKNYYTGHFAADPYSHNTLAKAVVSGFSDIGKMVSMLKLAHIIYDWKKSNYHGTILVSAPGLERSGSVVDSILNQLGYPASGIIKQNVEPRKLPAASYHGTKRKTKHIASEFKYEEYDAKSMQSQEKNYELMLSFLSLIFPQNNHTDLICILTTEEYTFRDLSILQMEMIKEPNNDLVIVQQSYILAQTNTTEKNLKRSHAVSSVTDIIWSEMYDTLQSIMRMKSFGKAEKTFVLQQILSSFNGYLFRTVLKKLINTSTATGNKQLELFCVSMMEFVDQMNKSAAPVPIEQFLAKTNHVSLAMIFDFMISVVRTGYRHTLDNLRKIMQETEYGRSGKIPDVLIDEFNNIERLNEMLNEDWNKLLDILKSIHIKNNRKSLDSMLLQTNRRLVESIFNLKKFIEIGKIMYDWKILNGNRPSRIAIVVDSAYRFSNLTELVLVHIGYNITSIKKGIVVSSENKGKSGLKLN